jgi:hypothetical protein
MSTVDQLEDAREELKIYRNWRRQLCIALGVSEQFSYNDITTHIKVLKGEYDRLVKTYEHTHDWRINPYKILTGNPPRQELVCASCKEISSRTAPSGGTVIYNDPSMWPKLDALEYQ